MRFLLRAGLVLGVSIAACGKDSPTPTDFEDPAAIEAHLDAVDSAFTTPVFASFNAVLFQLQPVPSAPLGQMAALVRGTKPALQRVGGAAFLSGARQASALQALIPSLSSASAEGVVIPDSLYGRVFEWDADSSAYTYQGSTVSGLTGIRYVLYAVGLDGQIVEPVAAIGTLDIIDQSVGSTIQLLIQVKGSGESPTYLDYTIVFQSGETSATATVAGFISNGLATGDNKTLDFDETFTVDQSGGRLTATFALNNPAITLMLIETIGFDDEDIVIGIDFRLIEGGQTVRTAGRIRLHADFTSTVNLTVSVDGHPVASINGDPAEAGTVWVDAGGEPLTVEDLVALDRLFAALAEFQIAVENLFLPFAAFAGL